jgi:hypothetical protein
MLNWRYIQCPLGFNGLNKENFIFNAIRREHVIFNAMSKWTQLWQSVNGDACTLCKETQRRYLEWRDLNAATTWHQFTSTVYRSHPNRGSKRAHTRTHTHHLYTFKWKTIHNPLTPWSTVLPRKLTVPQLVKFPKFHGTWRFTLVFTKPRH